MLIQQLLATIVATRYQGFQETVKTRLFYVDWVECRPQTGGENGLEVERGMTLLSSTSPDSLLTWWPTVTWRKLTLVILTLILVRLFLGCFVHTLFRRYEMFGSG